MLGWSPRRWRRVHGGYTPAARYLCADADHRAFLKVATNPVTIGMLRREARAYGLVAGGFMPRFFGWDDDPDQPLLLIEDLSEALWPPPWTPALVESVREQIAAMHAQSTTLPPPAETMPEALGGWSSVAEDPALFLGLGLVSERWLERWLPSLVEAEARCSVDGDALTHFDLRSDNICITGSGPKFIDWADAARGNPALDLGFWLPSLEVEGGPPPEGLLPDHPEVAAWVSGYFAARAGLPTILDAPRVRDIQRVQLTTAPPWAQRALGLSLLTVAGGA